MSDKGSTCYAQELVLYKEHGLSRERRVTIFRQHTDINVVLCFFNEFQICISLAQYLATNKDTHKHYEYCLPSRFHGSSRMSYDRPGLCTSTRISAKVDDRWAVAASHSLDGHVDGIDGLWFSTLQDADGLGGHERWRWAVYGWGLRATGSLGAASMS